MDLNLHLIVIVGFISLIFLCFSLATRVRITRSNCRQAPEPAGAWPIIGHLHLLGGDDQLLHQKLGMMADKYGPAYSIRLGNRPVFVASSSEVAEECFTIYDRAFASRPSTSATKHMCYNDAVFGFAPYSTYWREMRKIVVLELLSNRRLEIVKNVQASEVDKGINKLYGLWAKNTCLPLLVKINQWFDDLTLNVIVGMVAGKRFAGGSDDGEAGWCQKTISEFFHLMGVFVISDAVPFLWWLDLQGHEKAMKNTAKYFDAILEGWVDEHRRTRAASGSGEFKAEGEQDFIDVMLTLEEEGQLSNFPYDSNTIIKSTILAVIAAAADTTATMLTWAISLLMNHRWALKKAQQELDFHVGVERQVDGSDLKKLIFLQAIVKETLRVYPVAPLSGPREALEDCTIAGYHVKAGTRLLVNVWKIQRDPKLWTNPLSFQPERFLTSHVNVDVRGQNFELLPFGSGRRACPGTSFALHALHFTLARLLHSFDLATPMDQPVDMTEGTGITLPKANPVEVLLSPRLPGKLYSS
ncbi:hypothetical protein JCGZ_04349 [Jatropha curcas]|uniref:Cytochrome P450 n=1 Tax=Jatropha curcas TaxID=180498 RepID=A0A067L2T9_JATCU|nr:xanthotoxin 5-hydroxylase CYP82C4 [Jatropha curcas]KDP38424.1 hypothetical protein JCGZ_04349 [Jatropha curcas]